MAYYPISTSHLSFYQPIRYTLWQWLSHGRKVDISALQRLNVKAVSLADAPPLLDLIKEIWAAVDLTLSNTPAVRLTENHLGHASVRRISAGPAFAIQVPPQGQQPPQQPPQSPPQQPSPPQSNP